MFLPGATVGLRAGWPAGADPTLEALGDEGRRDVDARQARSRCSSQIQTQLNAAGPFFPLIQPGQVVGLVEEPDGRRLQRPLLDRRCRRRQPLIQPVPGRDDRARRSSRPFARFVARRLAALVLLAIGITFVAFVLTQLVPGDPAAANLGQQAIDDPVAVKAFREHYGLDKPLPEQYALYLWHLAARRPRRVRAEPRRR